MHVSDIIQIIILGWALGSVPFGVVLARLFHLPDPRYVGSGNIGATNMLRTGNKHVAALTLLLDMAKGAASVIITRHLFGALLISECYGRTDCIPEHIITPPTYLAVALLAAALGHMFSPWLKFKGGKGVATILGGALAFAWPLGMGFALIWLLVVFITRTVSLGSIMALAMLPLIAWLRMDGASALILALAASIAIWKHRGNISRLRQGFEPKITFGKGQKS
jgi:glycerol-3-phosphate acyltransferase PlsY